MVKWEVGKQYDRRDGAKVQCIGFCVDGRPVFELLTGLSGGIYATRIDGVHPYCKEQDVLPPLKEEFVGFTVHQGSNTAVRLADAVPDWDNTCMHRSCPQCHGTGWKKGDGTMCVHMISCPCPRCSPQCKV